MLKKISKISKELFRTIIILAFLSNHQAILEELEKSQPRVLEKLELHSENLKLLAEEKGKEGLERLMAKEEFEYQGQKKENQELGSLALLGTMMDSVKNTKSGGKKSWIEGISLIRGGR